MTSQVAPNFDDREHARLWLAAQSLADALNRAARELGMTGSPVSTSLIQEAADYQQQLQSHAMRLASTIRLPADASLSWKRIDAEQQRLRQRQQARDILEQLVRLQHTSIDHFEPLIPIQQAASQRLQALNEETEGDWLDLEIADLSHYKHPLAAVLALVTQADDLQDDAWVELQDRVSQSYGPRLTTALIRGHICIAAVTETTPQQDATVDELITDSSAKSDNPVLPTEQGLSEVDSAPVGEDLIFDTPSPPEPRRWSIQPLLEVPPEDREQAPPPELQSGSLTLPTESLEERSETDIAPLPQVPTLVKPSTPLPPHAGGNATHDIAHAVMKLIREERFALAAHLVEAGDADLSAHCPVSAQLLRACALARHISYPSGDLAHQLDRDLRQLPPLPAKAYSADDEFGLGLIVRAACLPPAMLGASTAATTLLRSFPIEPGTSQLYNFCSRVAAYGERMQGFAAEMFQATADENSWRSDEAKLQRDLQQWWTLLPERTVTYTRSSPLYVHAHWTVMTRPVQQSPERLEHWLTWQNVLCQLDQLLRPLRLTGPVDRQRLKSDVLRLTNWLEAPTSLFEAKTPLNLTEHQQNIVREGLELAHRWLRLDAAAPQRARVLASQDQADLLEDLRQRIPAVLQELDLLTRTRPAKWLMTGAVACRHITEYLQRLCTGQQTLAVQEPTLHEVLRAVLLKVPNLELDGQWQPLLDLRDALPQLMDSVHQDELTWRDAVELQSQQGDHLATQRLLDLPVWDDAERPALRQLRSQRLEQCRQQAHQSLTELIEQMQAAADAQQITAQSCEEWTERADRLLISIPRTLTFGRLWSQIDVLRQSWQRVSSPEFTRPMFPHESSPSTRTLLVDETPDSPTTEASTSTASDWVF
ncbi:hypothetical protein GC163_10410 [bacterium]|nr:hypothetical protein [bacterium]